jgi:glucose/arabinose dehydrogenase
MKKAIVIIFLLGLLIAIWFISTTNYEEPVNEAVYVGREVEEDIVAEAQLVEDVPRVEVIGENLTIPWEVVFLPDGEILVTERPGRVLLLKAGIELAVPDVQSTGEGGLLGAVLHPDFEANNYLYLYQTTEDGLGLKNRIVRYILRNNTITLDRVIADNLPGARFHDGGRIAFGPDGYLYVTVGDALRPSEAQDENTLEGTLLRMTDAGEPAPGNPFGSLVYSYGHRNAQGLAWDEAGNLWSSEHGRSVGGSGFDEINLITPGSNYGWPDSQGDTVAAGTVAPARHSTADVTWAPGGLAYFAGSLYMPGLRGETLYEAVLDGTEIVAWHEHLVGEYNRLRTVVVGPDNLLYLTTSNRDGRLQGEEPIDTDDRIIRINPAKLTR